jgi:hypothetical protein
MRKGAAKMQYEGAQRSVLSVNEPINKIVCGAREHSSAKPHYTDTKENLIFLIYTEIQTGAVANSYMTNGLLKYDLIFAHFVIYFLIYEL